MLSFYLEVWHNSNKVVFSLLTYERYLEGSSVNDWRVLFICTGNTCRSPMAEAIFNHKWKEKGTARSAGIFAADGQGAAQHTIEVLKENGIRCTHQSRALQQEDLQWATHIFTMTSNHKDMIIKSYPALADKTFTLKEFVDNSHHSLDVSDPFGGDKVVYRSLYAELDGLIGKLFGNE